VSQRRHGPYKSLRDLLQRVRPDETEARALIHCGAIDSLNPAGTRAALMWELACWLKARSGKSASKTRSLFGEPKSDPGDQLPPLPADDERERLRHEFAVLGFLCDRHPMRFYNRTIAKLHTVKAVDLPRFVGRHVRMAGWLVTGKVISTKHGDPMEFLTFEDETGIVETTFFPQAYRHFCHMIDRNRPYLLTGKVEADWGATTLTVDKVNRIT
jgi:DNA polymerase-3 subunit alpha/error-prone DNA polymerase